MVDLPMLLVGETARLLVMTDHGTHLVDVEAVAVTPDEQGSWRWTLAVTAERSAFALVRPATEPPAPTTSTAASPAATVDEVSRSCEGCGADPDEPCRWGCLSHDTTARTTDHPTDR